MSISDLTLSSEQGLAIFAALAGAAFLLMGRHSTSRKVLVTLAVLLALAGVLAALQPIHLQPTHAMLSDSESTAPQSVVAPTEDTGNESGDVTATGQDDPQADPADGTDDSSQSDPAGRSAPSSPAEPPVASPPQPDPSAVQESPGTDVDPDTGG